MLQNRGLSRLILKYTLGFCTVLSCVHFPFRRSPFIPATNTHTHLHERTDLQEFLLIKQLQAHFCCSYPTLTCRASPSLDRCLWPSAGGGRTSVAVGVRATAMAPGSRRCLIGSWREACRCVSWVQGVTWWCCTGFGHLLHKGERHQWWKKGGQTEEIRGQMNWKDCFPENAHRCWWQRKWHCMCQNSHHLKEKEKTFRIWLLLFQTASHHFQQQESEQKTATIKLL